MTDLTLSWGLIRETSEPQAPFRGRQKWPKNDEAVAANLSDGVILSIQVLVPVVVLPHQNMQCLNEVQ